MLWYVAAGQGQWWTRVREVELQFAGFAAPVLATLGYFWWRSALGDFIYYNLTLNMHWTAHRPPSFLFFLRNHQFTENPSLLVFGGLGLILEAFRESQQREFSVGKLLILSSVALIAGLWELPIVQEQYYLTFLPLLAIFSGRFMIEVATVISGKYSAWDRSGSRYMIAIAFLGGTIALLTTRHDWIWAHPDTRWLKESVVLLLVAGTVLMLRARSAAALTVLLCAVCICPYYLARVQFLEVNTNELQSLRYTIEKTSPTDTMMDGFSGIGVFRPHAYFYWFLDPEIVGMMTDEQKRQLLADLQTGKLAPRYLIMDSFLDDVLSPSAVCLKQLFNGTTATLCRSPTPKLGLTHASRATVCAVRPGCPDQGDRPGGAAISLVCRVECLIEQRAPRVVSEDNWPASSIVRPECDSSRSDT